MQKEREPLIQNDWVSLWDGIQTRTWGHHLKPGAQAEEQQGASEPPEPAGLGQALPPAAKGTEPADPLTLNSQPPERETINSVC